MTTIACPICAGPVALDSELPGCLIGHEFTPDDVADQVAVQASHALWAAVRSLEDLASTARWRMTLADPPPHLQAAADHAGKQAGLLRQIIGAREGASSDADHKPAGW